MLPADTGVNIIDIACKPVISRRFFTQGGKVGNQLYPHFPTDHQIHIIQHPQIGQQDSELFQVLLPALPRLAVARVQTGEKAASQRLRRKIGVRTAILSAIALLPTRE